MKSFAHVLNRLRRSTAGTAVVEFAYAAPLLLIMGGYGIETANMAITHLRVNQAAANFADNVSRMGEMDTLGVKKIREADIDDAIAGLREQSAAYQLTTYGRVIISSLERNGSGGQWIHWQRCVGKKVWPSSYGAAGDGATGTSLTGMGPAGQQIQAPDKSGVMFVEVAYDYQPIISDKLLGAPTITSHAAFIVRDKRDFADANNPANPAPAATQMLCTLHTT